MRNVSKINFIRKIPNQTLRASYYPPKTRRDIDDIELDYTNMTPEQIKNSYSNDFINEYRGEQWEEKGIPFRYKDGTEDVYTKSGYEFEIFEYMERQSMSKLRYRIITDATHIDFLAGGRVEIEGEYMNVVKVINMTNDVATQNKYRRNRNTLKPYISAPKILALM